MGQVTGQAPELQWKTDSIGDTLWLGETFLGCIYNQDGQAGGTERHGWRALAGEDLEVVGNALPTPEEPDPRYGARALLEAHVGGIVPLPTARELLRMTAPPWRVNDVTLTCGDENFTCC